MIRLSYVIPVYNSELYLERCVMSCMNQGLKENEYEIIVCDDGSTDNSLSVAERLGHQYTNLKVFSQKNAGAGMARNLGLRNASGEYVIFVDSDDYLNPNSVQGPLCQSVNHKLDVCRYVLLNRVIADGRSWANTHPVTSNVIFLGKDLISNPKVPLDTACSALYRLSFLLDNNLFFSHLTSSEDVEFTLRVYLHAERVMYDDTQVYVYEIKDDSRGHPIDSIGIASFIKNDLSIAVTIKDVKSIIPNSEELNVNLKLRSNSTTASTFWTLWQLRSKLQRADVKEIINYAIDLGVYPIKGKTFSWKTTLLAHLFFNNRTLFLLGFKN